MERAADEEAEFVNCIKRMDVGLTLGIARHVIKQGVPRFVRISSAAARSSLPDTVIPASESRFPRGSAATGGKHSYYSVKTIPPSEDEDEDISLNQLYAKIQGGCDAHLAEVFAPHFEKGMAILRPGVVYNDDPLIFDGREDSWASKLRHFMTVGTDLHVLIDKIIETSLAPWKVGDSDHYGPRCEIIESEEIRGVPEWNPVPIVEEDRLWDFGITVTNEVMKPLTIAPTNVSRGGKRKHRGQVIVAPRIVISGPRPKSRYFMGTEVIRYNDHIKDHKMIR